MADNLIVNGDFSKTPVWNFDEAGRSQVLSVEWGICLDGWTYNALDPNYRDWPAKAIDVIQGDYAFFGESDKGIKGNAVELIGRTVPGYIQQTIATEAGSDYAVTFWGGYAPYIGSAVTTAGIKAEVTDADGTVLTSQEVRIDRGAKRADGQSYAPQWREVTFKFTAKSRRSRVRFSDSSVAPDYRGTWTGGVIADVSVTRIGDIPVPVPNTLRIFEETVPEASPGQEVKLNVVYDATGPVAPGVITHRFRAPSGFVFTGMPSFGYYSERPYNVGNLSDYTIEPDGRTLTVRVDTHINTGRRDTGPLVLTLPLRAEATARPGRYDDGVARVDGHDAVGLSAVVR